MNNFTLCNKGSACWLGDDMANTISASWSWLLRNIKGLLRMSCWCWFNLNGRWLSDTYNSWYFWIRGFNCLDEDSWLLGLYLNDCLWIQSIFNWLNTENINWSKHIFVMKILDPVEILNFFLLIDFNVVVLNFNWLHFDWLFRIADKICFVSFQIIINSNFFSLLFLFNCYWICIHTFLSGQLNLSWCGGNLCTCSCWDEAWDILKVNIGFWNVFNIVCFDYGCSFSCGFLLYVYSFHIARDSIYNNLCGNFSLLVPKINSLTFYPFLLQHNSIFHDIFRDSLRFSTNCCCSFSCCVNISNNSLEALVCLS